MLMEALAGLDHKYVYEIIGHSGETHHLPFVEFGMPPRNRRERLAVVNGMVNHAAECSSGDNTLAAGSRAIRDVRKEEADDEISGPPETKTHCCLPLSASSAYTRPSNVPTRTVG